MITQKLILKSKPGDVLHDTQIIGLGLYVNRTSKTWKYYYRVRGTTIQRRPKIGSWPEMDIETARNVARKMAVQVSAGEDPSIKEDVVTLQRIYDEFVRTYSSKRKSETLRQYRVLWEKHIPQSLKRSDIRNIKRYEVAQLLDRCGGPTGNRLLALISRLYTFAFKSDYCSSELNPARGVERHRERPRERVASSDELRRIGRGINLLRDSIHSSERQFADLLALILLTGARISEWRDAKCEWVDYQNKTLNLPDSKTGCKTISLPEQALKICKRLDGQTYLFENPLTGKPIVQTAKIWNKFRKEYNLGDLRVHDLRRSYASYALNAGVELSTISKLLGHSNVLVTDKVYAKLDRSQRNDASEKVAGTISRLVG